MHGQNIICFLKTYSNFSNIFKNNNKKKTSNKYVKLGAKFKSLLENAVLHCHITENTFL